MSNEEAKKIIEVLLFVSDKAVSINEIQQTIEEIDSVMVRTLLQELQAEYQVSKRGFEIVEVAGGFKMVTDPYYAPWIRKLYKQDKGQRVSMPALETISIIAYKQPITKAEIESIRGVNVDGVLKSLLDKELVRITGRKETVGRPFCYGTTNKFLEHFGLKTLLELPPLKEFTENDIQLGGEHTKVTISQEENNAEENNQVIEEQNKQA